MSLFFKQIFFYFPEHRSQISLSQSLLFFILVWTEGVGLCNMGNTLVGLANLVATSF
jgi:hypothetical protein